MGKSRGRELQGSIAEKRRKKKKPELQLERLTSNKIPVLFIWNHCKSSQHDRRHEIVIEIKQSASLSLFGIIVKALSMIRYKILLVRENQFVKKADNKNFQSALSFQTMVYQVIEQFMKFLEVERPSYD